MLTELDLWLKQATCQLSIDSAAQVRTEIQEHYESAREAAMSGGSTADEADRVAVRALGNAQAANRQYRRVLLTSAEAGVLREGNWEAGAVCSSPWLKWTLLALPIAVLFAAIGFVLAGSIDKGRALLSGGIGMGLLFTTPFLPIYTPSRARVFRLLKWVALLGALGWAFDWSWLLTLKWSWLLASCLWPLAWTEWTRISIRRKLPVAKWPKQLYL